MHLTVNVCTTTHEIVQSNPTLSIIATLTSLSPRQIPDMRDILSC